MKKKQRRSSTFSTLNNLRGFSTQNEADEEGIKILSTPRKIKELEAENHKLKQMINSRSGLGSGSIRRFSSPLTDLADASRRYSLASSSSSRRVKFDGLIPDIVDIESHTEVNIADGGGENNTKVESDSKDDNSFNVEARTEVEGADEDGNVTNTTEEEKRMEEVNADEDEENENKVDDVEGGEDGNNVTTLQSRKRKE